ncbi:MAG: DUF4292 domain-containing protein, partial [Bacteroidota bacterium]
TLRYIVFGFLSLSLLLSSCKGSRKASVDKSNLDAKDVQLKLIQTQVRADWFNASAKISANGGGFSQSASASIKMRKDSLIWMSVKKLGFEIARAQITKDSVFLIDRFNRQYMANDLGFLSKTYNLPASLQTLQAVILGNPVFFNITDLELVENEDNYELSNSGVKKGRYVLTKTAFALQEMELSDTQEEQNLKINFKDYRALDSEHFFSYLRLVSLTSPDLGEMDIELGYQKIEIDQPTSIRFQIPKSYTKVE